MLTNERYAAAAALANSGDSSSAVIAEYITMPKALRESVCRQVYQDIQQSGLSGEEYIQQNHASLQRFAANNTMTLTVLVAFLREYYESLGETPPGSA